MSDTLVTIDKINHLLTSKKVPLKRHQLKIVKFIDLFAGLGGTRLGFEKACTEVGFNSQCVFTSEIKEHAIRAYKENFSDSHEISGDITKINPKNIPNFDYLLAGFPCQPFSSAGNRNGFLDERGNLFFYVLNVLKVKKPTGFLLENVEGLVKHDGGKTLKIILDELEKLHYKVSWRVLDSSKFGVPQKRIRIYIVGNLHFQPILDNFAESKQCTKPFIEDDFEFTPSSFSNLLTSKFKREELYGKSIKDKRGGNNNIHSWDLGLKGDINQRQADLLNAILKKRRYKKWALNKGIDWMDGMPLTLSEIQTFCDYSELHNDLQKLTKLGYLSFEHPKMKVTVNGITKRIPKIDSPKGYNIVAGKLSFPFAHIINPNDMCPTIVATEVGKIAVSLQKGVRPLTIKEGLAFSGFPLGYNLEMLSYRDAFDLIGNTVMPPVIKAVSIKLLGGQGNDGQSAI